MKQTLVGMLMLCASGRLAAQNAPEVIHLTVRPNPAPVPALKYMLLPRAEDIQPGNAAMLYYRSFAPPWWENFQRQKREYWDKLDAARVMPLDKLKDQEEFIPTLMLKEIDRAARREYCDWELDPRVSEEGVTLLLPEQQGLRVAINFLSVRARQEMAAGNIDAAIYTMQTGLQMAKHVAEGSTWINTLVGIAIGAVITQQVEQLIQLPDAPNLYWAFAQLPRPFVDLRRPLIGERRMTDHEFAEFREIINGPLSSEQLEKVIDRFVQRCAIWGIKTDKAKFKAECDSLYPKARQALAASGLPAADLDKMPAGQVVLLHSWRELMRQRDELVKWMALPYVEGHEGLSLAISAIRAKAKDHDVLSFVTEYGGGFDKVYAAQLRLDRKIAILRCIEATKLHVAQTGKLPATLTEITIVPLPLDPMINKPFEYHADGDSFTIAAALDNNVSGSGWRYEVKLAAPAAPK